MALLKTLLVLLALALITTHAHDSHDEDGHNCQHDSQEFNPEILEVEDDFDYSEEGRMLASYPNMRIATNFDKLTYGTTAFKNYVKKDLIPPVVAYFQKALRVKAPLKTALKLSTSVRSLCGFSVPSVLYKGVSTDHFLFFSAQSSSSSWAASSAYCYLSASNKRPLISSVRINTKYMLPSVNNPIVHEKNTYLLMHELTHSFGFSGSLFKYYLDSNGKTRKNHIKTVTLLGKKRTVLDIPELTTKLRKHFGCSSLEGAYLENNGGSGTASSHFERRHFMNEYMTSGVMFQQRISEFTLGVLEGSGWYAPNYDYAEPFYFGQGQGCNFLKQSCTASSFKFQEFCKVSSKRACTAAGRGGGVCMSDPNSDGCKVYYPTEQYDCENPSAKSYARLPSLQTFGRGSGSRCFDGTLSTVSNAASTTFCFKYTCKGSGSSTTLAVQVGSKAYTCKKAGAMTISGYKGNIQCPDPLTFCKTVGASYCPRNCMGNGYCSNGHCVCYKGWKGVDCGLRI